MTDKDPKDMTVSELLRKAGNGYEGANGTVMMNLIDLMGLSRKIRHSECLYALADKIDAELAQARGEALRQGAELWAKANGWPDFREGEAFGQWLVRCAIPRPRFEDGEPVHIGDKAYHPYTGETRTVDCINTFDDSYCLGFVGERSASLCDGERVKRPAPEVLGADGKPVMEGETVYYTSGDDYEPHKVVEVSPHALHLVSISVGKGSSVAVDPAHLTHTPPDTLERLRDDIAEWRADCARPGSGWDVKTAEWAARIDAIIRRKGGAE